MARQRKWPTGQRIVAVRAMTADESGAEGWFRGGVVLELSDGSRLYPSQDEEGNGPGALLGLLADGTSVLVAPIAAGGRFDR